MAVRIIPKNDTEVWVFSWPAMTVYPRWHSSKGLQKEALERIKILIDEINKAKQEQAQKKLPTELFTVYWILNDEKVEEAEEKARNLKDAFDAYPYWNSSEEHERKLKQELLKVFTKSNLSVKKSIELTNRIIAVLKSGRYDFSY